MRDRFTRKPCKADGTGSDDREDVERLRSEQSNVMASSRVCRQYEPRRGLPQNEHDNVITSTTRLAIASNLL